MNSGRQIDIDAMAAILSALRIVVDAMGADAIGGIRSRNEVYRSIAFAEGMLRNAREIRDD